MILLMFNYFFEFFFAIYLWVKEKNTSIFSRKINEIQHVK
ncbi:hypothetical protein yfred0001_7020 [Yersinia frederiksenii ATCC 33641]|nr:hypothetical protein yfred0001_7020 [Yersinia frederiksenii ATCC 33641]